MIAARLLLSAYCVLALIGWHFDSLLLWGAWHLGFVPAPLAWCLLIMSMCLIWLPLGSASWQKKLLPLASLSNRLRGPLYIAFLIITAALFAAVPSDNLLLGDSYRLINADNLMTLSSPAEYLTLHAYQYLRSFFGDNAISYRVMSVLAGLIFVWAAIRFSRELFAKPVDRAFSSIAMLSLANIQFFFGYVENYAIMTCLVSLFLLTGWLAAKSQRRLWLPALMLLAASASHFSAAFLLPGMIYLFWSACPPRRRLVFRSIAAGAIVVGASAAFLFLKESGVSNIFVPLQSEKSNPYSLLSLQHLVDIGNLLLLIAPAAIVLAISGLVKPRWKTLSMDRGLMFLCCSLLGCLIMLVAVDPKLGAARDWDLMSLFGVPASLLALALWREENRLPGKTHALAITTIVILLVHTIPWIVSNTDRKLTVGRFKSLVQDDVHYSPSYFDGDRLMAWGLMLGDAYGDHAEKERAFRLRLRAKPDDQRSWLILERALFDQNKHEESVEALNKITNFTTLTREQLAYYVRAMLHYNDGASALRALNVFAQRFPEDYEYLYLRGLVEQFRGDHAKAYSYYEKATMLREPDIDLLIMYCAAAFEVGNRELGRSLLLKAEQISTTEAQDEEIKELKEAYHVE